MAELFSTSLPPTEVEVKKSFIQLNPLQPRGQPGPGDGGEVDVGTAQPEPGSGAREEPDGWTEVQPTLRER